jgi:hypothetical protein
LRPRGREAYDLGHVDLGLCHGRQRNRKVGIQAASLSLSLDGSDERSNFPRVAQSRGLFEKAAVGFPLLPEPS